MADRYLKESGAPDGFTLEDGSGVLILESGASPLPFKPNLGSVDRVVRPSIQGGYSTVPNLLLTTLAVFAAGSQLVKREATVHNPKPAPAVQVFQVPNLLTSTLGVQVIPIPPGKQSTDSAPQARAIGQWVPNQNPLLFTLPLPVGDHRTESAPPSVPIGAAQQNQSRLALEQVVQPIPVGRQQVESAPPTPRVLFWDRGSNTLIFTTPPAGEQQTSSSPPSRPINEAQQTQSRAILDFNVQPLPIGQQRIESQVQTPEVEVFTPPQIQPPVVAAAAIPIGKQQTDSSPPTQRIGDIKYARGVDPGPPAPVSDPLPIGRQQTESALVVRHPVWAQNSTRPPDLIPPPAAPQAIPIGEQRTEPAPYTIFRPLIDEPQNLLAGPLGLPPVASSQSEFMPTIRPAQVFDWVHPNLVIRAPVVAQAIPIGEQRTESAPIVRNAVYVFTPPQIQPPVVQAIPIGRQQTDSAPIPAPAVQSFTAPVIIPPVVQSIPIGRQQIDSAPIPAPAVQSFTAPVIIPPVVQAIPVGRQQTDSAPIPAPAVQSFTAPVIVPPIITPLPIGQAWTSSAPIWTVPIGTSVGWTIPPDLLPPALPQPPSIDQVTGGWPMYYGKRIRKVRPIELTEIVTTEQIQENIQKAKERLEQKRALRKAEKRDRYVTEEIRKILDEQDRLKLSIDALKLQLEQAGMDEEDILLILALAG